jgi:hypothetical protein
LVEEEEKTLSEKWSWASRQATVPGARRPAGEEEKEEEVVKAERGPRERRRGPPTSRLRGAENGASWPSGWGRGAGKEGKVAGAAGAPRVWAASAGARCALLRLPGAARLGRLGSARLGYSALGRAAVPFSALPLIDWPACSATLANLAQRAALGGGGGRRGGGGAPETGGSTQGRAGPGENLEAGLDPERPNPLPRGPHRARGAPSRDTPRRTPPSSPPPRRRGAGPPPPIQRGKATRSWL